MKELVHIEYESFRKCGPRAVDREDGGAVVTLVYRVPDYHRDADGSIVRKEEFVTDSMVASVSVLDELAQIFDGLAKTTAHELGQDMEDNHDG